MPERMVNYYWEEPTTEDGMVTYYYFVVKGKEYFLVNIRVATANGTEWYTNYEEE